MRASPVFLAAVSLASCALLTILAVSRGDAAETVITDRASGCRVRAPQPGEDRTARWSGPCRRGFAHGGGVLEWYRDGVPAGWAEGIFADGRLEGPARVEREDGRTFTGRFRRGQASGPGILTFPEGHRYVGGFDHDRPTGQGEFISALGIRYGARVDASGNVWPGAMLGPSSGRDLADMADTPPPVPPRRQPRTLDEWLREPPPVPDTRRPDMRWPDLRLSERPPAGWGTPNR